MKNLKVSMKLTIGFGVILLCMVIIAGTVFITGQLLGRNLKNIDELSVFQTTANRFLDSFNDARIGANLLYGGVDDEEYNRAVDGYNAAKTTLDELTAEAAAVPQLSHFSAEFRGISDNIQEWMRLVNELNSVNKTLEEMQGRFDGIISRATVETQTGIYQAQFENLANDIRSGSNNETMFRRSDRVRHGSDLVADIQLMYYDFNPVIAYYNLTAEPTAREHMALTMASFDKYISDSSQQKDQDYGNSVKGILMEFSSLFDEYVLTVHAQSSAAANLRNHAAPTVASINSTLENINVSVSQELINAEQTSATSLIISVVLALFAIACGFFLSYYLIQSISKPLLPLVSFMVKASTTGDLSLSQEDIEIISKSSQTKDEIGETISSCANFVKKVTDVSGVLGSIADGDLTVDIECLSDKDVLGVSLQKMASNLNDMFNEINSSAVQVSTGAMQVADGAQTLAQGATEQASSVESLSMALNDISKDTKDKAIVGTNMMDEMVKSVSDINQASNEINKIIKVIDDIAFQTNILALNASVEAARAGVHGKGFAVVAEEVKNLANRSQTAARETNQLIANSLQLADEGSKIARDTQGALSSIVDSIDKLAEVMSGIEQISIVVQQNSATAQESAASSEQMSSQSNVMRSLIEQFKLRDSSGGSIGNIGYGQHKMLPGPAMH